MKLSEKLQDLAGKAASGSLEVAVDDYGKPFPAICYAGSPFEMANFTMGENADENQANADLYALAHNNLDTIIEALKGKGL